MKTGSLKNSFAKRNRLFRLIAVFLFFYSVADVTVLEYYCGNEALGIPSYAGVFAAEQKLPEQNVIGLSAVSSEEPSAPENKPEQPSQHDECLCACGHVLTVNFQVEQYEEPPAYKEIHFLIPKFPYSGSHSPHTFRPPRTV